MKSLVFRSFFLLCIVTGCSAGSGTDPEALSESFSFREASPGNWEVSGWWLKEQDTVKLPVLRFSFPIYRMDWGDLDGKEGPEVAIGLIKSTPLDSFIRKRMFIYTVRDGDWEALWKGSRFPFALEDFRLFPDSAGHLIRTLEIAGKDVYLVSEYRLGSFGPDFLHTLGDSLSLENAKNLFDHEE